MMRFVVVLLMLLSTCMFSQTDIVANEYFKKGIFEKALYEYKKLYAQSPSNINYIQKIVNSHQQLEQYSEAESFLLKITDRINYPAFFVDLGYNYQLQKKMKKAAVYYKKALASIDVRPSYVFSIANKFKNYSLLEEAVTAYKNAMDLNPDFDFNIQLAQLYGEQGDIEKMFNQYILYSESNPFGLGKAKRAINAFISTNGENENNILFRKILLKKMQQEPNVVWNDMLSWLFVQQKDFKKAFIQEKAIFNRKNGPLNRIEELALITKNENETELSKEIFTYIIETSQDIETSLRSHYNLLQLQIKDSPKEDFKLIKSKYLNLFEKYKKTSETLNLQIAYAHFLAFYMNETKEAVTFLESALELPLTKLEKANVKLELGDILVLQEAFNKALIYYTQIQRNLKNSTVSQEARYRVAKASYYKGDFKWAESQLKILKSSTSQLTANDALNLKLLISDNKYEDSLQTSLKLYAKADLLAFQNKNDDAILLLDKILKDHKTEPIIAQALFKQAQLFEKLKNFEKAKTNYELIIANYRDGVLIDDAYFNLAKVYENQLNLPQKAKELYEKIIFNHADSIYFINARKYYRALRGDDIN